MSEDADEFSTYDAAYVMGILDLPDRRAFELHLQTCDRCVAAVSSLRDLPEMMSAYRPPELADEVPSAEPDDLPPTLLPRLLDAVARQRRRRRFAYGLAAVTTLAACVIAIVVLATGGGTPAPGPSAQPLALTALVQTPVHATAELHPVAWGTKIDLRCSYDELNYSPGVAYGLRVVGRDGTAHELGDWLLVPGRDTTFTAGTSLTRADIATVQITTTTGKPLLQLSL